MSEKLNNRLKFSRKGVQHNFIINARESLNLTRREFAKKLKISKRTLADWAREEITISENSAKKISKLTGMPIPKNYKIIDWKEHLGKIGRTGAKNRLKLYGRVALNEQYRKDRWKKWWKKIGQYKKPAKGFNTLMSIKIPKKSKLLSEFVGILLGDGHISSYQVGITLSINEKDYILYVQNIIKNLFGILPSITKHKKSKAVTIFVSRKLLVEYCEKIGFKRGNKVINQVDIPRWIKNNKIFSLECVRGLVDTDGCFFNHSYKVGGKEYSYLKIAFTSASVPLRESVKDILINSGFSVRMSKVRVKNNGRDVRIDDTKFVNKYIQEIGSHNKKHLDKIRKWKVALNGKAAVC